MATQVPPATCQPPAVQFLPTQPLRKAYPEETPRHLGQTANHVIRDGQYLGQEPELAEDISLKDVSLLLQVWNFPGQPTTDGGLHPHKAVPPGE
jgi:hypothetical protein